MEWPRRRARAVEKLLGRGGMGEVFAVQDRPPGQRVALKALPGAACDSSLHEGETLAARLKRQGRGAALLRQMTEALAAARRVSVVHRDFNPGNCFDTKKDKPSPKSGLWGKWRIQC